MPPVMSQTVNVYQTFYFNRFTIVARSGNIRTASEMITDTTNSQNKHRHLLKRSKI